MHASTGLQLLFEALSNGICDQTNNKSAINCFTNLAVFVKESAAGGGR
jgi:hypothetical protein